MAGQTINTASPASLGRIAWRLLPALPFVLVLLVWIVAWHVIHPIESTLPSVSAVVAAIWERALDGELWKHISASLYRLFLGASIGMVTGIVGGFIAGLYRKVSEFLNPLVVFFNAISGIVWLPLMIGWLGIGTALAIFVIWNTVFFIVFQNTVLGVQLVPEVLEQGVQALGGGRWETIRSVILPGALPYILTGLRLGLAQAWRILVGVEMLAAVPWGLGWLIFGAREFLATDLMLAGIAVIAVIGLALEKLVFRRLEEFTVVRWGMMT
jgi:ABC-type nitrate/sulfonate/bicarbonate transport system permease component